jgi:hypothetical protein
MVLTHQKTGKFYRLLVLITLGLSIGLGLALSGNANAEDELAADYSAAELAELVGPIALYPDDLVAIVLPASSYPLQIVAAARYLNTLETNPALRPDDDWDDTVIALLNYPEALELLNQDLDWTWSLGDAVVHQQADVLDAIQEFRGRAVMAGNLETDERQVVSTVDEVVAIEPADPEVIYVPYYDPADVVVYQHVPVYHYYARRRPVYYYPYPSHYSFASGFFWGVTTAYTVGWLTDRVHSHHYGYASHPYYGRHYATYYRAPRAQRLRHHHVNPSDRFTANKRQFGNTWRPAARHGQRSVQERTYSRKGNVGANRSRSTQRLVAGRDSRRPANDVHRTSKSQPTANTRQSARLARLDRPRNLHLPRSAESNASPKNRANQVRSSSPEVHATQTRQADQRAGTRRPANTRAASTQKSQQRNQTQSRTNARRIDTRDQQTRAQPSRDTRTAKRQERNTPTVTQNRNRRTIPVVNGSPSRATQRVQSQQTARNVRAQPAVRKAQVTAQTNSRRTATRSQAGRKSQTTQRADTRPARPATTQNRAAAKSTHANPTRVAARRAGSKRH